MAEYNLGEDIRSGGLVGRLVAGALGKRVLEITRAPGYDVKQVDVKLIINGIEFDAKETLERMSQIRDEHINSRAKELVSEHVGSLVNELYDLEQRMKAKLPWSEIE